MARIVVLVADGYTDSGLSVLLDVLRTANVLAPGAFQIDVASAKGGPVRAASGLTTAPTRPVRAVASADVVVAAGIWLEEPQALDALLLRDDVQTLSRALARAHRRGALVTAACAGVFLLAKSGALDGKRATTTWWLGPELKRRYPAIQVEVNEALIVDEGVVTAGAVFGVADLALHLVTRFLGPAKAQRCCNLLLLDRHPSQAPYMAIHQLTAHDPLVRQAEKWVRAHMREPFEIATLAKAVGTSPRTLARRLTAAVGVAPVAFVQRLRVETAIHLLRTTRKSTHEIGAELGYADESTLRKLLRRETRASARELRQRA